MSTIFQPLGTTSQTPSAQHHTAPSSYSQRLPPRFQPSGMDRAAIVMHLHERCGLHFREISKLMHYKGPDTTRRFYLRACAFRRLFTSDLPPDIKAAWRLELTSALFPSADIGLTPDEGPP